MTIAMSLLIHGEAVRFNRGQSRGDDFDFKYMRGRDGREYPYVSSQCYKKYWRESLQGPFSPIIRAKDAAGKEKNQAFTSGNPIKFVDDDLFGYMIAGATDDGEEGAGPDGGDPDATQTALFEEENIKDAEALKKRFLEKTPLSEFILSKSAEARATIEDSASSPSDLQQALLSALENAARSRQLAAVPEIKITAKITKQLEKATDDERHRLNKELLMKAFSKELKEKPKRATERRTAPLRMHALVAFSGIKTAKDFQTFSRDIAYTGANSVLNPNKLGIYSAWLKTRILIESHRIGKFYVGENMDILSDKAEAEGMAIKTEPNPYSSRQENVSYVQLDIEERRNRLRAILRALADIGNRQGPASGALHDGSLRPKAFVAGMMKSADSPFDYVWAGHNDDSTPYLDVKLLRNSIEDWEDLFATKTIYVGLPADAGRHSWSAADTDRAPDSEAAESPANDLKKTIEAELAKINFTAVVDTPRKAMLRLAQDADL